MECDSYIIHVDLVAAHTSVFFIYVCHDVSYGFHSLGLCIKKKNTLIFNYLKYLVKSNFRYSPNPIFFTS